MSDILTLTLRRLRAPLITLISVYAIAIFGLVLMPGVDDVVKGRDGEVMMMMMMMMVGGLV